MKYKVKDSRTREIAISHIMKLVFKGDKVYNVEITLERKQRTIPQNRLYRLYLACIEAETGNDADSLHDFFKHKYLKVSEAYFGGEVVEKVLSTTKLNIKQFTEYLQKIVVFASHEGIVLPDPDDYAFEQFYEHYKHLVI